MIDTIKTLVYKDYHIHTVQTMRGTSYSFKRIGSDDFTFTTSVYTAKVAINKLIKEIKVKNHV